MNLQMGKIEDLQVALGGVSYSYAQAVKKAYFDAINFKQTAAMPRMFDIGAAVKWRKNNPNFKSSAVWPKKRK